VTNFEPFKKEMWKTEHIEVIRAHIKKEKKSKKIIP
jgi:hypothetical protein